MDTILPFLQAVTAVGIVILVLLQERSGGASGIFGGGGDAGGVYQARRGMEKIIFKTTILFGVIFVGLALARLFV